MIGYIHQRSVSQRVYKVSKLHPQIGLSDQKANLGGTFCIQTNTSYCKLVKI